MDSLKFIEQQLDCILKNQIASKEVLTFDETTIFTGFSKSYLYKLTSAGLIPHSKPLGKHLFFNRVEIQAWLLSKPVKTASEIESQATNYVTLKVGKERKQRARRHTEGSKPA